MYIITFYSFKGGVGRTMALVNVAAELVRRGRKVLVVDFDLQAPGLETYRHIQPPTSRSGPDKPTRKIRLDDDDGLQPPTSRSGSGTGHPGIVEYVTEY